jgi:hypothetical protein
MFRNAFCAFQYFKEQLKKKLKFSSLFIKKSIATLLLHSSRYFEFSDSFYFSFEKNG